MAHCARWRYDALGRVATYTEYGSNGALSYQRGAQYDADSLVSQETENNGSVVSYYRDADGTLEHSRANRATRSPTPTRASIPECVRSRKRPPFRTRPWSHDNFRPPTVRVPDIAWLANVHRPLFFTDTLNPAVNGCSASGRLTTFSACHRHVIHRSKAPPTRVGASSNRIRAGCPATAERARSKGSKS